VLSAATLLQFRSGGGILPVAEAAEPTCDWSFCQGEERDPALQEMTYDVGDGPETTWVYVEPELNSFYQNERNNDDNEKSEPPSYSRVPMNFNGLTGKFINMSNKPLDFYWESAAGGTAHIMTQYPPFSSDGTGTFPRHRFFLATPEEPEKRLNLWIVGDYPENVYAYDPYLVQDDPEATEKNLKEHLDEDERWQYDMWRKTLLFNEQYRAFTGRSYLANYGEDGPRAPPSHYMWRADYFGQQHWVTTRETHFLELPPESELGPIRAFGSERILSDTEPRHFPEYRAKDETTGRPLDSMNLTLTVLSCAPRVFEIRNFLSQEEVDHVLYLAGGITLKTSQTGQAGDSDTHRKATKTRTSKNSWIERERSPIIDTIYRRASDLTRIDEALLRERSDDESESFDMDHTETLAESLQLVHYDVTQEYTAHHDFGYSHIEDEVQGARFATLLLYLNDGMVGGETAFPRYVNGKSFHELRVKPEPGKAVLFYDQLPDGNMDDFSQHSAKPIIEGEKWLINLWIWDPEYGKD